MRAGRRNYARIGRDLGCAAVFVLLGWAFIHRTGLQTDEAMFASPLFREWKFFSIPFGHKQIPIMNMPYNGALKTWLYAPLVLVWNPGAGLIRIPILLIGGATVVLFGALAQRLGSRAAWIACLLVATDTSLLLTTVFDWGPVALQHLLMAAAMLLSVSWFETKRTTRLAAAGFCCGLALWDKAVFVWILSGLLAGCLVYLPELRRRLRWRAAAAAVAAMGVGALPLIVYNLAGQPKWGTIRLSNPKRGSDLKAAAFVQKFDVFRGTWDGSALFALVNESKAPRAKGPRTVVQRASFRLHEGTGARRRNYLMPALVAALLLIPLLWRTPARKAMCFCLIAMAVAWVHMAVDGGGWSPHHVVLLWPLPQLLLAAVFAEASRRLRFGRWMVTAAVGLLVAGNLLLTNEYFYRFSRDGADDAWSDAIYALAADLKQSHASQVLTYDWGMLDSLCVLDRNQPTADSVDDPFLDPRHSPEQQRDELKTLSDRKAIWVGHAAGHESLAGVNERLWKAARRAGFEAELVRTYFDSNGRAIYEAFRFRPSP